MGQTKEKIWITALELFAQNGYEAVSVSDIAGQLGITKGALYKHYTNKRAIFDCIIARMEQQDAQRAGEFALPEGTLAQMPEKYCHTSLEHLTAYSKEQFRYWTQDPFAAPFRRMLTLEQYRCDEMARLYQQYLAAGPLGYVTDLLGSLGFDHPRQRAAVFYAPMFLLYSVYDGAEDKEAVVALADDCLERELQRLTVEQNIERTIHKKA